MEKKRRRRKALWNETSGSLHRLKLMLGIPTTGQDRRGLEAEDKTERALEYLQRKGLVNRVERTVRFGSDDLAGKDFIVTLLDGKSIAIDVKNHHWNREKEQECREKGILLVTIWESDTDEIAREKILNLIICAYLSRLRLDDARALIAGALRGKIVEPPPKGLTERLLTRLKGG